MSQQPASPGQQQQQQGTHQQAMAKKAQLESALQQHSQQLVQLQQLQQLNQQLQQQVGLGVKIKDWSCIEWHICGSRYSPWDPIYSIS